MLKQDAGVVTSRNHVHYIVTEHGVADLHGKTTRPRVQVLVNIAAPEYREELMRFAERNIGLDECILGNKTSEAPKDFEGLVHRTSRQQ